MAELKFDKNCCKDKAYWEGLGLNENDTIVVDALEDFTFGLLDLRSKLQDCANKNITIKVENTGYTYESAALLYFFDFSQTLKNENHRSKQLSGIKDALALKYEGKGNYGRPLANLPENFKEEVIKLKRTHQPLEVYRKTIGIKKSTFYKYAKPIVDQYEKELALNAEVNESDEQNGE